MEEWRTIAAFPDYAVSSEGRVKRIVTRWRSKAGRVLRQSTVYGYKYVFLMKDGQRSACRVHRLVCAAFNGPPPAADAHVAHNDGSRSNNRSANLRWATASENMRDKEAHGTVAAGDRNGARTKPQNLARGVRNGRHTKPESGPRGASHGCAKLSEAEVVAIRADPRPQREIAAEYGVTKSAVGGIKSRRTWRHIA